MTQAAALFRALAHRATSTLVIFSVALIAATGAAVGPAYYAASKTSILRDTVASVPPIGRGFEVTETGDVATILRPLATGVSARLAAGLGSGLAARRLFMPPVEALEVTAVSPALKVEIPLVWRGGVCAHLRVRGRCPDARNQVAISASLARTTGWHTGQRLRFPTWGTLNVTGIYLPPATSGDYWFGHGSVYFPYEEGPSNASQSMASAYDAMFTPVSTFTGGPQAAQGTAVYDDVLMPGRLRGTDVASLLPAFTAFVNSSQLAGQQAIVVSDIPATLDTVQSSWKTLAVPVVLITAQLLALAWLLLFVVVKEAAEARGTEVALAKLRGYGRGRTVAFGLSEPVTLLIVALPAGALAGWAATAALGRLLLRPGTPVLLPPLAWAAAGAAIAGGLAAVVLAAQQTLRRPVIEQWRRAGRRAADRGWMTDAILVTGAVAALLDLAVSGRIGSARRGALGLAVPGLLGLAVAVTASRLLPLACRATFGLTGRRGGIGPYLAVRHIARRPGGVRTTMMLGVSLTLAAFAVTAWSVSRGNYRLVAETQVGAPDVLTVSVPPGTDLGAIVDRADPGGRMATVVDNYTSLSSGSSGQTTLGVDPQRFARIAAWRPGFAPAPLAGLARQLDPPEPPPVTLAGDEIGVTVTVRSLSPSGSDLVADVHVAGSVGATPIDLGRLPPRGSVTMTGQIFGCPCRLTGLYVSPPAGGVPAPTTGTIVFGGLRVRAGAGWRPVPGVFARAGRWRAATLDSPPDVLSAGAAGLGWRFITAPGQTPAIAPVDTPVPMPAVASAALTGGGEGTFRGAGLDGNTLDMRVIAAAAGVPGAPAHGLIVDRRYAELAANGNLSQVTQQVWLAPGARRVIEPRLAAAGVRVVSVQSAANVAALLGRQGPGLASVLFLADAAAAALLATGAAVLGLYLSARRRRYEYAALAAAGVPGWALRGAVAAEQLVVLGFGGLLGVGTGLAAAALVLPDVPEFITAPVAPPLSYAPAAWQLAALLGMAVTLLLAAAVTAAGTLIRGVDLDQLREAPP